MTRGCTTVAAVPGTGQLRVAVLLAFSLAASAAGWTAAAAQAAVHRPGADRVAAPTAPFVANVGQQDPRVAFVARTPTGPVFVTTAGSVTYALAPADADPADPPLRVALVETLVAARPTAPLGGTPAPTRVSEFSGRTAAGTTGRLPAYGDLTLGEVYPGVTLTLAARPGGVEKRFLVRPGGAPDEIRVQVAGGTGLDIGPGGELLVFTAAGPVAFSPPQAFQWHPRAGAIPVPVAYRLDDRDTYGFLLGPYDPAVPLLIDPLLAGTYLAGPNVQAPDRAHVARVSSKGYVYVAGFTESAQFPTTQGAYQSLLGGRADVFVSVFDENLSELLASTYLGAGGTPNGDEEGLGLAVDPTGEVYVAGYTRSRDFPTTPESFQPAWLSQGDICGFVTKFDGSLTRLVASTYLCSEGPSWVNGLELTADGRPVVMGGANEKFPTTPGAFDETFDSYDAAFVVRLSPDLRVLEASTLLEGGASDEAHALSLLPDGTVLVAGQTRSPDFPVGPDGVQFAHAGGADAFVVRLDADLTTRLAGTFLGGQGDDGAVALADADPAALYVTGTTTSAEFPTTPGALKTALGGTRDAFLARLDAGLTVLEASTLLGGNVSDAFNEESAVYVGVDGAEVVFAGGYAADDFPSVAAGYQPARAGGRDIVVARLDRALGSLLGATYYGGTRGDVAESAALDACGNLYLTGMTNSPDLPVSGDAFMPGFTGGNDAFVARLDPSLRAECPRSGDVNGDGRVTATDAQVALLVVLGLVTPTAEERCAADCDGRCPISAADAQAIFGVALGVYEGCVDGLPGR